MAWPFRSTFEEATVYSVSRLVAPLLARERVLPLYFSSPAGRGKGGVGDSRDRQALLMALGLGR
jgi:hypothetical protein